MNRRRTLKMLAGATALASIGRPALAHALPGATITLQMAPPSLAIVWTAPLHDIDLAFPEADLADATALQPAQITAMEAYLRDHLALVTAGGITLRWRVGTMTLDSVRTEEVGAHGVLSVDLTATLPQDIVLFPLALHYDAILHQVRSQDALVFAVASTGERIPLGEIAYSFSQRRVPPLVIPGLP